MVPIASKDLRSTACAIDGVAWGCGSGTTWMLTRLTSPMSTEIQAPSAWWSATTHTFTVTVVARQGTFSGSTTFVGSAP